MTSKTVALYASGFDQPKHMAFKDGTLYVANQNADSIKAVGSANNYLFLAGLKPIGMAVYGGDIFSTGTDLNAGQVVYKNTTPVSVVPTGGHNFYGLAFDSTQMYVAEVSPDQIVRYTMPSFSLVNPVINIVEGSAQGIGVSGSDVFATVSNTGISANNLVIKISGNSYQPMAWGTFNLPNAIVFDGTYAYIANRGGINGEGGYISRKKMSDASVAEVFISATSGIWKTTNPGFCGLAGLAISGSYLYASNGSCTSGTNANTVLKIKL